MVCFKLSNSLQLQYNGLFIKLDSAYVSSEIYVIEEDELTAYGNPTSICFSMYDGRMSVKEQDEDLTEIESDMLPVIDADTPSGELMRYILMRLRAALQMKPYADPYMLSVLRGKLNELLKVYNIKISDTDEMFPVISLQMDGTDRSVEYILSRLMVEQSFDNEGHLSADFDMHYTRRLMGLMRYDEALELFLNELGNHDNMSMLYTELCMYIG